MTIRGLAAPISKPLRTEKTRAFENQTLRAIVSKVTLENGLTLEGEVESLKFKRVTQRRERDMEFLARLAEETGHYFTVKGMRAIFTSIKSVDGRAAALVVGHAQLGLLLTGYRLKEQTAETYSKAKVTALHEDDKQAIEAEHEDAQVKTGDTLRISGERVENHANAEALARSRLHFKNRKRRSGSTSLVGDVRALAGVVVEMTGFGQYSGTYVVDRSTHAISRSGYTTDAELVDARP